MINVVAGGDLALLILPFVSAFAEGAKANVPNVCRQSRDASGCNKLSTEIKEKFCRNTSCQFHSNLSRLCVVLRLPVTFCSQANGPTL